MNENVDINPNFSPSPGLQDRPTTADELQLANALAIVSAKAKLKQKGEQAKETVEELHMQGRYRVKLWQFQEFLMQEKGLRTYVAGEP